MVTQKDAMDRLNQERDFEDRLAQTITIHFMNSLEDITDITPDQKKMLKEHLSTIRTESTTHSHLFNSLAQMVLENGEANY